MKVTVVERSRTSGAVLNCPQIEISDNCPVCGEKRGEAFGYNFWEDGTSHWCQQWKNPCGHVDLYTDVIKEAQ